MSDGSSQPVAASGSGPPKPAGETKEAGEQSSFCMLSSIQPFGALGRQADADGTAVAGAESAVGALPKPSRAVAASA